MAKKSNKATVDMRINRVAKMLSTGSVRSEIGQYASEHWGLSQRQADKYIQRARAILAEDFEIDRRTFTAELLSQLASLQKEARESNQGHIALGCINSAAKLAQLIS